MKKITVNIKGRGYGVFVGHGILDEALRRLPCDIPGNPFFVISNRTVLGRCGGKLVKSLKKYSKEIHLSIVPDSEKAKSFSIYKKVLLELSDVGKGRNPVIFALGGGVVGDLSGFCAATYKRGIKYVQVPTTLLAQVDSSIGGKVAIDLDAAKNIVGSFYQPAAVISDTVFLGTLPDRQIRNGLAEIIKYSIIDGKDFFEYLEGHSADFFSGGTKALAGVISECARIKAGFVEKDEFDRKGHRMLLNLGHTFGHAIEAAAGYSGKYCHGEGVAIGMAMAASMAAYLGICPQALVLRVSALIEKCGLPVSVKGVPPGAIIRALAYDKKFISGKNRFVLPAGIGRLRIVSGVSAGLIERVIKERCYHGKNL